MLQYKLAMGIQHADIRRGGSTNLFVMLNLPWQRLKKTFTKIEAYAGMAGRMVRDLEIDEALQDEIKETL